MTKLQKSNYLITNIRTNKIINFKAWKLLMILAVK